MQNIDYLFIVLLFVVQPIHGYFSYRKYIRRIATGAASNRVRLYRETMLLEWLAFAALGTAWIVLGRPATELGFVTSSPMQITLGTGITSCSTSGASHTMLAACKGSGGCMPATCQWA